VAYGILLSAYVLSAIAALAMLILGIYARSAPKSLCFTFLVLAIFILNTGFVFEVTAGSLKTAIIATQVEYIGGSFISLLVLLFFCEYCGLRVGTRAILLLMAIPVFTCILVLTWPLNGIYYESVSFSTDAMIPQLDVRGSFFYYFFHSYSAALPLVAFAVLFYYFPRRDKMFKRQSIIFIFAAILPLFSGIFVLALGAADLGFDPLPIFLGITCLILGFSFIKLGFYRVAPIAREQIVETMSDGFVILDNQGKFVDANIAAKRIMPQLSNASAGIGMDDIEELAWLCESADTRKSEFSTREASGAYRHYQLSETQITKDSKVIGRCIMIFDVTHTKQLLDEVSLLAERDTLTGLFNRRTFFNNGELLFDKLSVNGDNACMMMMDLDFFKKINDTYGHPKGDEVLKTVAEVLPTRLRNTDLIARYGGEEFSAFLPYITQSTAYDIAEQLRTRVQELDFSANGTNFRITISIGLAIYDPSRHLTLDMLLADADTALYAAKNKGRNRVCVAT